MPPALRKRGDCMLSFNISIDRNSSALVGTNNYNDEDKHALLYIVCTLLFYSLGMIVGIVSYIKREKQDIEQDRMFNEFLTSFRGNTEEIHYRQLKVQETIERLAEIERDGGFSEKNISDLDLRKNSSGGINLGDKKHLFKLTNLGLLRSPAIVVNNMTSEVGVKEPEIDKECIDPFQDIRLSKLVAEMLDNQHGEISNNTQGENENVFIEKDKESELADLGKATMQKIELNTEDILTAEENSAFGSNEVLKTEHNDKSNNVPFHLLTKNTVGKSVETVFGITIPQENTEIEVSKKKSTETEFSAEPEQSNRGFRWSVTSV